MSQEYPPFPSLSNCVLDGKTMDVVENLPASPPFQFSNRGCNFTWAKYIFTILCNTQIQLGEHERQIWGLCFKYIIIKISFCDITLTLIRKVAIILTFVTITTENNCTRHSHTKARVVSTMLTAVS